jgi:hypothetical protein
MSFLQELKKQPEQHVYADIIRENATVTGAAEYLNISAGYLSMILRGDRKPGKRLEKKIVGMVDRIKAELEQA